MDTNIFSIYRICVILCAIAIIKRILTVKKASKNIEFYSGLLFWICTGLNILTNFCFVLLEFGGFYNIPLCDLKISHLVMMSCFFVCNVCFTIGQFIFLRRYATYNIVYNDKIRNKKKTINYDESFIIIHKIFKDEKIWIKDIMVDESCYYSILGSKSRLFPLSTVWHIDEYAIISLSSKKKVKIHNNPLLLQGANLELLNLVKALGIPTKNKKG